MTTAQLEQVEHLNPSIVRTETLFSHWKRTGEGYKGKAVPLVPHAPNRTGDTEGDVSWHKRISTEPVPPSLIPSDYSAIPWPIDIDPLHLGLDGLTGRVPDGWSRDGWIMVTKDRMKRTDCLIVLGMLQAELGAIEGVGLVEGATAQAPQGLGHGARPTRGKA